MRTKKRIKQSVQMRARTGTTRVGLPARHEVEIFPSTARTRTPNAVRDSLSERLIARKGARPPIGKEESVSGVSARNERNLSKKAGRLCAPERCAADICGVRLGARLETWGRDDECDSRWCRDAPLVRRFPRVRCLWSGLRETLLFCLRSVRRKVVEQAQWGGTRKSAKYKKRGGDIREDLYPNVLYFSVSADAYPLLKYARPGREPPLETWGHVNIHEVWIPLAKVVCCGWRALCRGTRSRSKATAGIGARKYGRREDSGHVGHKVIK
ncbi:hypothetical protein B0H14DRAFT_2650056 [Mycena olivaceomarginata]|nr:hypothetical protein B0H14DRAFT_2650056 [Mycena olivaceomarginata]